MQTVSRGRRLAQRMTPSTKYRNSREMTVSEHWNEIFYPYEGTAWQESEIKTFFLLRFKGNNSP